MHRLTILAVLSLTSLLVGCFQKELPLPEDEQGIKTISGSIYNCDFEELGSSGWTFMVGIELDAPDAPYVRANITSYKRAKYEDWCEQRANVTIEYQAKSTELRPEITYWIEDIEIN